jgi:hypothetical protein
MATDTAVTYAAMGTNTQAADAAMPYGHLMAADAAVTCWAASLSPDTVPERNGTH